MILSSKNSKCEQVVMRKLNFISSEGSGLPQIMTTKELAEYLKLHEVTIGKHAAEGKIPARRVGRAWSFDKKTIDKWIAGGNIDRKTGGEHRGKAPKKNPER
jgi:excisionase family DNA binding protein